MHLVVQERQSNDGRVQAPEMTSRGSNEGSLNRTADASVKSEGSVQKSKRGRKGGNLQQKADQAELQNEKPPLEVLQPPSPQTSHFSGNGGFGS